MRALGLTPAASAFAVTPTIRLQLRRPRQAEVALSSQSDLPIRYTLDGSAPTQRLAALFAAAQARASRRGFERRPSHADRALPGQLDRAVDARFVRRRERRAAAGPAPTRSRLALEDDYPAEGPRAVFLTDIFNPCWIYADAPLGGASRIAIDVGQMPFNFQVGKDVEGIKFRAPATPDGEFEVRAPGCDGERIAVLPLAPARANPGRDPARRADRSARAATQICASLTPRPG